MRGRVTDSEDAAVLERGRTPRAARVVEELEATRREMRKFHRARGLVQIALAGLAIAALVIVADWMWVLPTAVRASGLLALTALGPFLFVRRVVLPTRRFGREDAAAEVESQFPGLGQRVRTTLEYTEPAAHPMPASPGLVRALVLDTDRRIRSLDFRGLIPWARFERLAVGLVLLVLAASGVLIVSPELRIATGRLFLLPMHYSHVEVTPGDQTIKVGNDFTLTATMSGRPVPSARWLHRKTGSHDPWTSIALGEAQPPGEPPQPLLGALTSTLNAPQTSLEYRVVAGPIASPTYRLTVIHPLTLKGLQAAITPPTYTRKPPSVVGEGNFRVLEGSKVRLQITLDRAPKTAELELTSPDGKAPVGRVRLKIHGNTITGELPPLNSDVRYEIAATAADGMTLDANPFRIQVKPDEKPTIQFVRPHESTAALPTTDVPVQIEAGDDLGLARVGIAFRVNDGPEESLYLNEPKDQPLTVEALTTLFLEKHNLTYTDGLTYYAFVEDNKPYEPHRVSTELCFLDILPYKQMFQLVEGGGT